jgi:DNA modification methylase
VRCWLRRCIGNSIAIIPTLSAGKPPVACNETRSHDSTTGKNVTAWRQSASINADNQIQSNYIKESKRRGHKIHPARFPAALPLFFIRMLTEPGETVLDPFAGSNTTGWVAESMGRKWIAVEKNKQYAEDFELRFHDKLSGVPTNGQRVLF